MPFKQNLPVVLGVGLVVAGLASILVFFRRSEEELVRDAAAKYGAARGPVLDVRVYGTQADIAYAGKSLLHAEFALKNGTYEFTKDLGADFERVVQDPALNQQVLQRLAQRLADRWGMSVRIPEGLGYRYVLERNKSQDLLGQIFVDFAYPKQGNQQRSGGYRESFLYQGGAWVPQLDGALFDRVPPPRR